MRHQAIKVRLYPTTEQQAILAQHFGCSRWWWNHALNLCIETYKETGKGLTQIALNKLLPQLKKQEATSWLGECYSQILQATTLNLVTAYKNFIVRNLKDFRNQQKNRRMLADSKVYSSVVSRFCTRLGNSFRRTACCAVCSLLQ